MKLKMFLGALAVSAGLCGQSFGFELLDRMLGLNNGGGSCCAPSCCEQSCAPEPTCCEAAPAQSCGCEAAPSCCDSGCGQRRCHDLFGGLKGLFDCHRCKSSCHAASSCGCEEAAPSCGCEAAPSCGCEAAPSCCGKRRHHGLLHHLFAHKHRRGNCCESACSSCDTGCSSCQAGGASMNGGYEQSAPTPAAAGEGEDAPAPPAPMADPSASYRSQNRVFQASKYVRTR